MVLSGALSSIGEGLIMFLGRAEQAAKGIIDSLIRIFRQVLDWVYAFMFKLWENIQSNPWGAMHLFTSFWIMMA